MEPKAIGTFRRRGQYIFRTEARLQWGDSTNPLGLIIMLNPGSSKLANSSRWLAFERATNDDDLIDKELELDKTMEAVSTILEQSHPKLNGILEIRNLFNLRTARSNAKEAISTYKEVREQRIYEDVLHSKFEDLVSFPWVWIGWTVDPSPKIKQRKLHILKRLPHGKQRFGIYKEPPADILNQEYYSKHPFPQLAREVDKYRKEMVQQMQDYWKGITV